MGQVHICFPSEINKRLDELVEIASNGEGSEQLETAQAAAKLSSQLLEAGYAALLLAAAWMYVKAGDFGSALSIVARLFLYTYRTLRMKMQRKSRHRAEDG